MGKHGAIRRLTSSGQHTIFFVPKNVTSEDRLLCGRLSFDGGNGQEHPRFKTGRKGVGVTWCATEGCSGGTESTVWKLLEKMDQGSVTLVVDRAKAFEKVQLKVVWA